MTTGARTNLIPLNGEDRAAIEFSIVPRSAEQVDRFFSEIVLKANNLGLKGVKVTELQAEYTHGIPRETIIRLVVGDNEEAATPAPVVATVERAVRGG